MKPIYDLFKNSQPDDETWVMTSLVPENEEFEEIKTTAQFGRVHAIQYGLSGNWIGAADPDWSGTAKGLKN
jgi:hypothetical protein